MSCKCQDTETKRCRWEHPSDSWTKNQKVRTKAERKAVRHDPKKAGNR